MNNENPIVNRVVVMGANGGIGRKAMEQALEQGYTVLAVVRDPDKLNMSHPKLTIQKADVTKPETLIGIFEKNDVVISAIGKNSTKSTTLYSEGDRNIMRAMAHAGVSRLFVISASGLEVNLSHNLFVRWATKNVLQRILRHMYADLERMEAQVKVSDLDWTIVRPPRLVDNARTGRYRVSINDPVRNGMKISRADVADFILANIFNTNTYKKTVELAY